MSLKNTAKTAVFEEKAAKISSRGYRPAPLFERTPPSAVTARRPPGVERRQKTGRLPRILIDDRATMPERSFVRKEQVT